MSLHPAIEHVLKFFRYDHLPANLQGASKQFCDLAEKVANAAPDSPETTVALRKLLEAKDAAVRALLSVVLLLIFSSSSLLADGLKIVGDLKVDQYKMVKLKVTGLEEKAGLTWRISPRKGVSKPTLTPKNSLEFTAPPGVYEVLATSIKLTPDGYTQVDEDVTDVTIGDGVTPIPPGPVPPTPTPVPPVPPVPAAPISGKRVLIIFETSESEKLTEKQQEVLYGKKVRDYLRTHCEIGPDGKTAEWNIWDKDIDTSAAAKVWQDAMRRPRTALPWIILGNGTTGYEGPLPATVDETLTLLKKFYGE